MRNLQFVRMGRKNNWVVGLALAAFICCGQMVMADLQTNQNSQTLQINDNNNVTGTSIPARVSRNKPSKTILQLSKKQYETLWDDLSRDERKNLVSNGDGTYTYTNPSSSSVSLPSSLRNQPIFYREKVYTLFNKYFDLSARDEDYATSSTELYQDRGVKGEDGLLGDVTWIATADSRFYASALSAGNANTLSIVTPGTRDVMGNLKWEFGSGENQILDEKNNNYSKDGIPLGIADNTEFEWMLTSKAGSNSTFWFSNTENNIVDDMIHMIVLEVSDLMLQQLADIGNWTRGTDYDFSLEGETGNYIWNEDTEEWDAYYAYMLCWEDIAGTSSGCDFDYQDMVALISYIEPVHVTPVVPPEEPDTGGSSSTPEPATMLILGLGAMGAGFVSRRRMSK